jgi:glutaminase
MDKFSITIITVQKGDKPSRTYQVGDTDFKVSIQSAIKPIIQALILTQVKSRQLSLNWSGNKTTEIDKTNILPGRRMFLPFDVTRRDMLQAVYQNNPYTSILAIQNTGTLIPEVFGKVAPKSKRLDISWSCIQKFLNMCRSTDVSLSVDRKIYQVEKRILLKRYQGDIDVYFPTRGFSLVDAIDLYALQCSLMVSSKDCAELGFFLANCGVAKDGTNIVPRQILERVLSSMFVGGLYETSGTIGLPAKSGIGGSLIVIVPGQMIISIVSPKLDEFGNSVRAVKAAQMIVQKLGLSLFDC